MSVPFADVACHASAPPGLKCSDCSIDGEPCPTCYETWWKTKHPNVSRIGGPVVVLREALEQIATFGHEEAECPAYFDKDHDCRCFVGIALAVLEKTR